MKTDGEEATQGTLRPGLKIDTLSILPHSVGQTSHKSNPDSREEKIDSTFC